METMELKTAILHSLDMNLGMPVVSQVELELSLIHISWGSPQVDKVQISENLCKYKQVLPGYNANVITNK